MAEIGRTIRISSATLERDLIPKMRTMHNDLRAKGVAVRRIYASPRVWMRLELFMSPSSLYKPEVDGPDMVPARLVFGIAIFFRGVRVYKDWDTEEDVRFES